MKQPSKILLIIATVTVVGLFLFIKFRDAATAPQILNRMAQTYANCKSYRDSGTVKTLKTSIPSLLMTGSFTTAFVRPTRFRFEYKGSMGNAERNIGLHYIISRKEQEIYSLSERTKIQEKKQIEKWESLAHPVAKATGTTAYAALDIPAMLLPEEIGRNAWVLPGLKEPQRLQDENIGGINCFCITGKGIESNTTIWVAKTGFLVRRIDWKDQIGNQTTRIYEPTIDNEITDTELEFNPN